MLIFFELVLTFCLGLNKEKPTKVKIKAVLVKVSRWRALALVLRSKENEEKIESMDAALTELMNGIGAKLSTTAPKKPKNSKCCCPVQITYD